jgi:cytochrome P450
MADDSALELTPAVERPPHVSEALVYDFDFLRDPGFRTDPHGRYRQVVEEAPPVFWTPRGGGHWMVCRHDLVFEAARDFESFSSELFPADQLEALLAAMPPDMRIPVPYPINLDPPLHTSFRIPLNAPFSPKAIAALKDDIRALAVSLVDAVASQGGCEFMSAVAEPLPVQVFLKFMGLPLERQPEFRALVRKQLSAPFNDGIGGVMILREIADTMRDIIIARRDDPKDDLISRLWRVEIDGRAPTQEDMENYGVLLFIAGLDTVINGLGFGVGHLARDPELQARLRADPSLIPEATEELLRRYTFVAPIRLAGKDLSFHGAQIKRGERVLLGLPAGDLDPQHWPKADQVDIGRQDKAHLAFNVGPHRCVGSHLARLELQTLYEEFLARIPPFALDPERPPAYHGGIVLGVDRLNLLWPTRG